MPPPPHLRGSGLPWAGLAAGWHRATVPPNSARSGRSHRAHTAASSGVYRPPPHDGCTATRGCSETSRGRCARSPEERRARTRMQQIAATGATHAAPNVSSVLPVERLLRRHEHGNYFPGFVPLWWVNLRPCRPPHAASSCFNPPFRAGTPAASPVSRTVAFSAILGGFSLSLSLLVPELISSPVQFLTRNIHSLIPFDVTAPVRSSHRPLLWTVPSRGPPSWGRGPGWVWRSPADTGGNPKPEMNTTLLVIKSLNIFLTE